MRTLFEIINAAKGGQMPTHEECYWAMLAFSHLHHFDHNALLHLGENSQEPFGPRFQAEESFKRFKAALGKSPKGWVGWSNDPANPEYQKKREIGRNILKKFDFEEGDQS